MPNCVRVHLTLASVRVRDFYSCGGVVQEKQIFISCTYVYIHLMFYIRVSSCKEKILARARALTLLLIGKYRNARNIEHLDGTTSVAPPLTFRLQERRGGCKRRGGARGLVGVGVGVATIFSTTGLHRSGRPFSLNEFDGFREIGNESCARALSLSLSLPARYLGYFEFYPCEKGD